MPLLARITVVFALAVAACGGSSISVLHAVGKPTGEGAARVRVKNASGVTIEKLYVAKAAQAEASSALAADPGSPEGSAVWGDDQLDNAALADGRTFDALALAEDRYDVLVFDHDRREQLVKGISVRAGGKYLLEIRDDWAIAR
jgi:hypothetical protein